MHTGNYCILVRLTIVLHLFLIALMQTVLHLGASPINYTSLGCWQDAADRAIPLVEGWQFPNCPDYWIRLNPIEQCALAARQRGFSVFAVQVRFQDF